MKRFPIETRLFHKLSTRHRLAYVEAVSKLPSDSPEFPLWEYYYRCRLLQDYISDGTRSVLFSTHILADLEQIADYIFFIDHGKKIFWGAKEDLTDSYLLVKGGREDLSARLRPALLGIEKNDFGFEAL